MDPDNVEIVVVDDERNAARVVSARNPPPQVVRPAPSPPPQAARGDQQPTAQRPVVYAQPMYAQQQPRQIVVVQPPRRSGFLDALATVDVGQAVKTLGGVIASFKPLPESPAPAPADHHDRVGIDLRNLAKHQTACFEHGKADERVRTLFNLLGDGLTFFTKAAAR
jgi:hypothetical protein